MALTYARFHLSFCCPATARSELSGTALPVPAVSCLHNCVIRTFLHPLLPGHQETSLNEHTKTFRGGGKISPSTLKLWWTELLVAIYLQYDVVTGAPRRLTILDSNRYDFLKAVLAPAETPSAQAPWKASGVCVGGGGDALHAKWPSFNFRDFQNTFQIAR